MMKNAVYFLLLYFMFSCASVDNRPRDSDLAGTYYRVKPHDTLAKIANKFHVSVEEIMDINGISDQRSLRVGQAIFLPEPDPIKRTIARLRSSSPHKPRATKTKAEPSAKIFDFPVPKGVIVRHFSTAKKDPYDGIGIKAPLGSPITAPMDGRVLFVGDDKTKFGLLIILEHHEPYITVYAHLQKAQIKTGQLVKRGQTIGHVGTSGGVTFPHLHFQVRVFELPKDPKLYLKRVLP